jgi:hypothetical protein
MPEHHSLAMTYHPTRPYNTFAHPVSSCQLPIQYISTEYGMHDREVHTYERYTCKIHAHGYTPMKCIYIPCETPAHEGFCEDLARQTTVTHLSQLQLGFRRCRIWVSVAVLAS